MAEKIFTSEFWLQVILNGIVSGIIVYVLQKLINLKFDPLTASETLKKENFLNAKRDVYFSAIKLINQYLANTEWTDLATGTALRASDKSQWPTSTEVNSCYSMLCIYTDNKKILEIYIDVFDSNRTNKPTTQLLSEFAELLRQDLGYKSTPIDITVDEYRFIHFR